MHVQGVRHFYYRYEVCGRGHVGAGARARRGAEGRGCERMGVCGVQEGDDEEKILVAANFRVAECHPKTEFWL
jgi:hypothetical protein